MADEEKKPAAPAKKRLYRLTRRFDDGKKRHEVGAQLHFLEGMQPKSAVLVEAPVAEKPVAPAPKAPAAK